MHAGERAACSVAYADAQALQHAFSSLGAARMKGKLRSARVLLACAGERELHAGERAACSEAFADAQALKHVTGSLGAAKS